MSVLKRAPYVHIHTARNPAGMDAGAAEFADLLARLEGVSDYTRGYRVLTTQQAVETGVPHRRGGPFSPRRHLLVAEVDRHARTLCRTTPTPLGRSGWGGNSRRFHSGPGFGVMGGRGGCRSRGG